MPAHQTPSLEHLPRREREVMDTIHALGGRVSVEEIRSRMTSPPSYSAVRAMAGRLEAKGYLRHDVDGGRYLYSATGSPASARRTALQRYVHTFFGGSIGSMMVALVRDERWSDDELEALRAEVERVRRERKRR